MLICFVVCQTSCALGYSLVCVIVNPAQTTVSWTVIEITHDQVRRNWAVITAVNEEHHGSIDTVPINPLSTFLASRRFTEAHFRRYFLPRVMWYLNYHLSWKCQKLFSFFIPDFYFHTWLEQYSHPTQGRDVTTLRDEENNTIMTNITKKAAFLHYAQPTVSPKDHDDSAVSHYLNMFRYN